MATNVTVANATALDKSSENSLLTITFTNTNAFDYAANSTIYYYALLTDGTADTPQTREVVFTVPQTAEGTVAAGTSKTFTMENDTNLAPAITASDGKICYQPK
ncbi:MAG: hypothetical protein ACLSAP_03730 [Oscillospiraceae bacterium]